MSRTAQENLWDTQYLELYVDYSCALINFEIEVVTIQLLLRACSYSRISMHG